MRQLELNAQNMTVTMVRGHWTYELEHPGTLLANRIRSIRSIRIQIAA